MFLCCESISCRESRNEAYFKWNLRACEKSRLWICYLHQCFLLQVLPFRVLLKISKCWIKYHAQPDDRVEWSSLWGSETPHLQPMQLTSRPPRGNLCKPDPSQFYTSNLQTKQIKRHTCTRVTESCQLRCWHHQSSRGNLLLSSQEQRDSVRISESQCLICHRLHM